MKTILAMLVAAFVLALDWAALHDILKGKESDLSNEYYILGLSPLVLGLLVLSVVRGRKKCRPKAQA